MLSSKRECVVCGVWKSWSRLLLESKVPPCQILIGLQHQRLLLNQRQVLIIGWGVS